MHAIAGEYVGADKIVERAQERGAAADLIGQRRHAQIDAFARIALGLAVEPLMLPVFLEQDHGQQARPGKAAPLAVADGGLATRLGSAAIVTAEKPAAARAGPQSSCRQRYSWLAWMPASRATVDATAPGSIAAATIRSFSVRDQRRRRSTDVITSTSVFVIGLSLGLVL